MKPSCAAASNTLPASAVAAVEQLSPGADAGTASHVADGLIADLDKAIGERDQTNGYREERIARYIQLSQTPDYGDTEIPEYDEDRWLSDALNEEVRGLRDKSDSMLTRWDPFTDVYTWKNEATYKHAPWFRFQEAVKTHQDATWTILDETTFNGLELEAL